MEGLPLYLRSGCSLSYTKVCRNRIEIPRKVSLYGRIFIYLNKKGWIQQSIFGQRKTTFFFSSFLSACGHSHSFNSEMGEEIEYFHGPLRHTLMPHPDQCKSPKLICLHRWRSIILPGQSRKSDSITTQQTFWPTCDHTGEQTAFQLSMHVSLTIGLYQYPSNFKNLPKI